MVHSGADYSPDGRRKKQQRDLRLLQLELVDRPEHPFALFNLGMTYADMDRHEEAIEALQRSLQVSRPSESHVRKLYALLIGSSFHLGQLDNALSWCQQGRGLFPNDPELLFREGIVAHQLGNHLDAERAYLQLMQTREERHFTSVDSGIGGFKARHNLAVVYTDMNRLEDAEQQWELVVKEMPAYRPGWRGLCDNLLRQSKLDHAESHARRMLADDRLRVEGLLVQAEVARQRGQLAETRDLLKTAVQQYPDDPEPRQAWCRFLFEHGDPDEAEQALQQLAAREPKDGAVRHNLGALHLRVGRLDDAVREFRESIQLRPDSANTHMHLGNALRQLGRTDEAACAWREAVRLDPTAPAAAAALEQLENIGAILATP